MPTELSEYLDETQLARVHELSDRRGQSPRDLIRTALDQLEDRTDSSLSDEEVENLGEAIHRDNAELYRRLA